MQRVRLVHWDETESQRRAERLAKAGYDVDATVPRGPAFVRALKANPPAAIIIDLTRLPSYGRDLALAVRNAKTTRRIPLVFVEGDEQKVERIRKLLPDAEYTSWRRIVSSLKRAIAHPPAEPVVPGSNLAGYSGTPLPKKLGIKAGYSVVLVGAPDDFQQTLGALPDGVTLRHQARGRCDLVIWFCQQRSLYERRLQRLSEMTDNGDIWVAWPKAASGLPTDLTQQVVREFGLASGLVDYKICAVDAIWSALRFTRRK